MLELTLENFEEEVLNFAGVCLVAFKHGGCHLCRGLSQVLERLKHRYGKQVKFATIDTLDQKYITNFFDVDGVPTIFLFIDGDGTEMEYPDSPSSSSGYSEKYVVGLLNDVLNNE